MAVKAMDHMNSRNGAALMALIVFVLISVVMPLASVGAVAQDVGGIAAPEIPAEAVEETITGSERVFGQQIFTGNFAKQNFIGFNPDYQVAVGDRIRIEMWGGAEFNGPVTVDAKGNIFIPRLGPIRVQGVMNRDLNDVVNQGIRRAFKKNVGVYASLNGAEPVKVFVTGAVRKPGLYAGHASDSVLYFLDRAKGVEPDSGSYLDIDVLRDNQVYRSVNLYTFLRDGVLPIFQFRDGDVVIVRPAKARAEVTGEVHNQFVFEFEGPTITAADLFALARPRANATHVRIVRNDQPETQVKYLPIADAGAELIRAGDVVELTSDKTPGTISVRVEGEHLSSREFVLPYGAKLGELLAQIDYGINAQVEAIQLERLSVKVRQRSALEAQLRSLETSVLTANSKTPEEASLRAQEAELVLEWVDRARKVEPRGIITVANSDLRDDILLEAGDIVRIPRTSNLVLIHGEVLFPTALTYQKKATIAEYIAQAGGFTQGRGNANVLLLHRDGTFEKVSSRALKSRSLLLRPGDEIFVLPKVQSKNFQFAKDIIQILYQLALSAGVVLRL